MRTLPVVCLLISVIRLITGKLIISRKYLDTEIKTDEGKVFRIFRYISLKTNAKNSRESVFLVSFKFASLSFRANKLTSIIPMLIIAGTPGFTTKIYAVCRMTDTGWECINGTRLKTLINTKRLLYSE